MARRRPAVDRAGATLAVGSIVNGLAALAFIRLGNQVYGAAGFAPVSIVWSVWSVTVAVLTFPMQHWTIREGRRRSGVAVVRSTAARLMGWTGLLGVAVVIVASLLGADVLRTSSWLSPVAMGILVAMAVPIGFVRGELVARDRYTAAAWLTGGENLLRLAAAGLVVLLGLSVEAFLFTLALGPLVLLFWPRLLWVGRATEPPAPVRDIGELSAANSLSQLSLAGGPILMAALGAPDRLVTAVFNTLSLARAPYLVLLGASMRLTAIWSDQAGGRVTRRVIAGGTVVLAAVAGLLGAVFGPWIVEFVFGPGTALPPVATGLIAAASTLALGTLAMTSRYTAENDTTGLARAWLVASLVGAAGLFVPAAALVRVLTWFVLTEAVAVAVLGFQRAPVTGGAPD